MIFVKHVKFLSVSAYIHSTLHVGNRLINKSFYALKIEPYFFYNRFFYKRTYTNYKQFINSVRSFKMRDSSTIKLSLCDHYVKKNIGYVNDYVHSQYNFLNGLLESSNSYLSDYCLDASFSIKRKSGKTRNLVFDKKPSVFDKKLSVFSKYIGIKPFIHLNKKK